MFELVCRPGFWYPADVELVLPQQLLVTLNGLLHYRLLTSRPVTWRWLLFMSAMDIALITVYIILHSGFDSFIFVAYYPALALFVAVFTSPWLGLAWTTLTAGAYALVCLTVDSGFDFGAGHEKALIARLAAMYALVLGFSLIIRFERVRRQAAVEGERQLQRERIEFSQEIHDTTAQTAYMIGLGIHRARQLAGESNEELAAALNETAELSMSAMWELRRPIDAGHIFEGRELGRVLRSHCASFEKITAVPAGVSQSGTEPTLANETRARLYLHSAQRADQRLPACPARPGRGEAGLRSRPDKAVRLRDGQLPPGVGQPFDPPPMRDAVASELVLVQHPGDAVDAHAGDEQGEVAGIDVCQKAEPLLAHAVRELQRLARMCLHHPLAQRLLARLGGRQFGQVAEFGHPNPDEPARPLHLPSRRTVLARRRADPPIAMRGAFMVVTKDHRQRLQTDVRFLRDRSEPPLQLIAAGVGRRDLEQLDQMEGLIRRCVMRVDHVRGDEEEVFVSPGRIMQCRRRGLQGDLELGEVERPRRGLSRR